ncbi:PPC domain-containing protein [Longimicrobium terrae]|uniref:Peptidase C-terminal archaeal/bacterial domain-containing protein n=1 Tax=Longimicrobium terrae TaxID=1639882 RepID=A0A841H4B7_9BACT|nr:PPC domain-containing protein [Longimicrobium terrae]MBB4638826.1 hypothetical protein [Longimicrobium terrae]MBB6073065.1 hypothetical protein [Longimicrobium terrae]NNC33188.1 hypothetical protein [Longimicrobium terrae]
MNNLSRLPLIAAALALAACSDTSSPVQPTESREPENAITTALTCTASTRTREVRCSDDAALADGVRGVIVGNQNGYVRLTSSNVTVALDTISFDVTVENLIAQPLGTTNGSAPEPEGVRVFFVAGPASTGAGTVTVANPDGVATINGPDQPYFQYNGPLSQNTISEPRRWKLQFSPEVTNVTFKVLVSAAVQFPDGYVDNTPYVLTLNLGETRNLPGAVFTVVGNPVPGAVIDWSSSNPGLASVNGSQVTAGGGRGFATLTATSGSRPATYSTVVSVCQSTVVNNGTSLPSSIAGTDCFSSYGDPTGRPTNTFYADLYRVALNAGQTVTITMDSGDDLDTYLLLADPRLGFLVAGNDDDDEGVLGVGSRIVYTATETGVYVIEASTFGNLDTGNYTLNVTIN